MLVLMSRFKIEGRKIKYSDVTVASMPHFQSDFNFLVMEANLIVYIFYAGGFCGCDSTPRTVYGTKCLE